MTNRQEQAHSALRRRFRKIKYNSNIKLDPSQVEDKRKVGQDPKSDWRQRIAMGKAIGSNQKGYQGKKIKKKNINNNSWYWPN